MELAKNKLVPKENTGFDISKFGEVGVDDATKYWNSGKTYSFFAVYPYTEKNVTYKDGAYKLFFSVPSSSADVDLMTATATISATKDGDGKYPTVEFDFSHALSMINIHVKKNGINEEDEVKVSSVSFSNVKLSGNYNMFGVWEDSAPGSFSCILENEVVLPGTKDVAPTFNLVKGELMFLPQEIAENTILLTINYSINKEQNVAKGYLPCTKEEDIKKWEKQKIYTYNITLGEVKNEILFNTPVVKDWKNEKPVGGSIIIQ